MEQFSFISHYTDATEWQRLSIVSRQFLDNFEYWLGVSRLFDMYTAKQLEMSKRFTKMIVHSVNDLTTHYRLSEIVILLDLREMRPVKYYTSDLLKLPCFRLVFCLFLSFCLSLVCCFVVVVFFSLS